MMAGFVSDLLAALFGGVGATASKGGRGSGWPANGPLIQPWRATSKQVCGLFPFIVGSNTALVGAPLGRALRGGGAVCADEISWFERGLISAPSAMVLGLNGLGKSSLVRRMITASAGFGVHTMVLGDIKPDYVALIEALGGQVISIEHGGAGINPLDAGNVSEAVALLEAAGKWEDRDKLVAAAHERKKDMVCSLIHIIRRTPPSDREETIVDEAIRILETYERPVVLADLLEVVRQAPGALRAAALDRGDLDHYRAVTESLEASLMALVSGRFGALFAVETTTPMMMDRCVVFDVSAFKEASEDLQAALLLACWSYGFATVEIAQTLADAGVAPRRRYKIVMDELWRILRASSGLVERIDSLTRLNRTIGVGQVMITHSMADFNALASPADRLKAAGFVERSKMLFLGGMPAREMSLLEGVFSLTEKEKDMLTSWNAPGTYDPTTGRDAPPLGMGKFLLKTSNAPGTPFQVRFVDGEAALSDTNQRWARRAR